MENPYIPTPIEPKLGEKFYGRQEYIDKILSSDDKIMLILGARRIGKTSLFKQIEYLSDPPSYIGVYLDLLRVKTQEKFADELCFSGQNEFFKQIQFDVEKLKGENLFESLSQLDGMLQQRGTQLLLLCDEAEKFIDFDEPFLKSMQSFIKYDSQMIRLIFTASQEIYKLHDTCREWDTPPFLHGVPEVTLSRLAYDEAEGLIRQINSEGKPAIEVSSETVSEIQRLTDNHPFLIQCLCYVLYDDGGLLDVTKQHLQKVFDNFPLSGIFFDLCKHLSPKQRMVLLQFREVQKISESELSEKTELPSFEIKLALHELTRLCYIKKLDGEHQISNDFFKKWLDLEASDKISIMEEKDVSQVEQLRVLQAINKRDVRSIDDIYNLTYLERYKIVGIVNDLEKQGFIEVEPYALTEKGQKHMAELRYKQLSPEEQKILLQFRGVKVVSESELSQNLELPFDGVKPILLTLIELHFIEESDGKYQIPDSPFKEWLNSEEEPAVEVEEIAEEEKLLVLQAIAKKSLASIYDVYLFSYIALHRIKEITEYLTTNNFIKKGKEYTLNEREVSYYSLTKEGKKYIAELERARS